MEQIQYGLERETVRSAPLLRRILGQIHLKPIKLQVGPPCFQAKTTLQALERLGMSACAIAMALKLTDKTITKTLRFAAGMKRDPLSVFELAETMAAQQEGPGKAPAPVLRDVLLS